MKKSIGAKTIVFPTPVLIVGTYDNLGKPNLMAAAWGGICCSKPPCVAISLRKATYTYGNIVEKKAFTINILSETHVKEADYYGIATGRDVDKFAVTGITPVKSEIVDAPYGREFPMVLECKLLHTTEIGLHTQFIGEIMDIKADEEVLGDNRLPDVIVKKCSHAFTFTIFLNIVTVSMSWASILKLNNLRNGKRFNFDQRV